MLMACSHPDVGKIVGLQAANVDEEYDCGQNRNAICHTRSVTHSNMVNGGEQAALQAAVVTHCSCSLRCMLNQFRVPAPPILDPPKLTKYRSSRDKLCLAALHEVPKPA